ncbi:glycosyltransferase [Nocardia otitidiscaviarum]|uniref:glycosyltransferase n=1 Tax=Nocardia otitidiscaviarum TaxID=1823 RepID=UPI0024577E6D|nr:glycosyltransferase [Nocardia otitidiscaviarum]
MAVTGPAAAGAEPLRILLWHVHGSWTTSFVQGGHRYLLPADPARGEWALGRCGRPWPETVAEVAPERLADERVDVVVLQRPRELDLVREWLGRTPGRDVPAVYVEHNTPREHAATSRHPMAERSDITLAHVTSFNRLMWDSGDCPTIVIPHGVPDPGPLYSGELARAATIINEPVRRWRVTGTDLLTELSAAAPVDVYGMGTEQLHRALRCPAERVHGAGDLTTDRLHAEVARRRVFLHTPRWTSLGLSLIEAMLLGMPVVAVGTTEAPAAIPPEAGVVSTDPDVLTEAVRGFVDEPALAALTGKAARQWALTHFGLDAFLARWDRLLADTRDGQRPWRNSVHKSTATVAEQ